MVTNIGYKNTDIGVIPKDWDCIHLCTLGKLLSGLTYTPEDVKNYGLLVLRSSNIQEGRLCFKDNVYVNCKIEADKYVKQGDLLICVRNGSRALIGKCALIDKNYNATFGAFMALFRSPHGKYLYQLFSNNTIQEQINRNCGATINQITSADFNRFLVAFPQNPKEQAAISEALSDVDNLTSSLQKLIEKKKAIKQGAMQELLTGKKRFLGFSGEWETRKVGELCSIVTKQTDFDYTSTIKPNLIEHPQSNALPMIQTKNFEGRKFNFSTDYYIPTDIAKEFDKIVLDTVCLLFSIVGASVGNIGLFPGDKVAFCGGAIGIAKFYHEIDAIYAFYYFLSASGQQQIRNVTKGGAQATVTIEDIREFTIPYPNLKERTLIAQTLSDMDNEIEQLEKKLAKYQQIKQGMMQELLTGRIRLVDADRKEQPKTQILQERQPAHNQHFDDAVMIAGIVNAFYSEKYPLGRKKIQKLLYLVRRKEQADISAFHKKAAGPYADEVRYKGGEPIAQKNKYIQVKRNEKGSRFEKGMQMQQALTYLQDWGKQGDVDWLVSQFQYTSVNELELLATVDMAICDLRQEDKEISVASIKDLIRSNKEWRDKLKKAYFKDADILRAIKHCQELFPDKEG